MVVDNSSIYEFLNWPFVIFFKTFEPYQNNCFNFARNFLFDGQKYFIKLGINWCAIYCDIQHVVKITELCTQRVIVNQVGGKRVGDNFDSVGTSFGAELYELFDNNSVSVVLKNRVAFL